MHIFHQLFHTYFSREKSRQKSFVQSSALLLGMPPGGAAAMIAQLPRFCQSRRCSYNAGTFKFLFCRPQWAEARRPQGLVFGAAGRKYQILRRASPVMGVQGVGRLGTPAPRGVSRRHTPWRLFGSFLGEQKGTFPPSLQKENV